MTTSLRFGASMDRPTGIPEWLRCDAPLPVEFLPVPELLPLRRRSRFGGRRIESPPPSLQRACGDPLGFGWSPGRLIAQVHGRPTRPDDDR